MESRKNYQNCQEAWDGGIDKFKHVDLEHAKGRLELVIEQNSSIDQDRLKVPPEMQDVVYSVHRSLFTETLKDGTKMIAGGLACEALAYGLMRSAFILERTPPNLSAVMLMASFIPIIPGLQLLGYGTYFVVDGIKDWLNFKREKWSKPLTERERQLANYVLMRDIE